jgi:hypothetical protein
MRPTRIAVIGGGQAPQEVQALAEAAGEEIAAAGAVLVCGGLGGVMEAAARGARRRGGHTIGLLPSYDGGTANRWIEFALPTGLGEARNVVVVAASEGAVAFAGEGGTLAEIGLALKLDRPVIAVRSWQEISAIDHCDDPREAVRKLLARIAANRR